MTDFHALQNKTVIFIGGGNMAGAMIGGLLTAKDCHDLTLTVVYQTKMSTSESGSPVKAY